MNRPVTTNTITLNARTPHNYSILLLKTHVIRWRRYFHTYGTLLFDYLP